MTAQTGLSMLLKKGAHGAGVTVAGLQATTMKLNNTLVDVTTKDSAGWKTLLAGAGVQSVQVTASGVFQNAAGFKSLMTDAFAATSVEYSLFFGDVDYIDANFIISNFEVSGPYDKEQTFTCTLESSGAVTSSLA